MEEERIESTVKPLGSLYFMGLVTFIVLSALASAWSFLILVLDK